MINTSFLSSSSCIISYIQLENAYLLGLINISTSQETLVTQARFKDKKYVLVPVYTEQALAFRFSSSTANGRAVKEMANRNDLKMEAV